jgi:hypothetical protein
MSTRITTDPCVPVWTPADSSLDVTSGGSAWADGAWVEVLASTPANMHMAAVSYTYAGTSASVEVELGTGTAGNEVAVGCLRDYFVSTANNSLSMAWYPVPWAIGAGVRLAVRIRGTQTSTHFYVRFLYYTSLDATLKTTTSPFALPSAATLSITPSGTAWTSTAWAELTSGLGYDCAIAAAVFPGYVGAVCDLELDLGTGADGAETVITTFRSAAVSGANTGRLVTLPAFYQVAAGTRIAARLRTSGTNTTARTFGVVAYTAEPVASSYVFPALTLAA